MSVRPELVLHEILARGFRSYSRGIVNGFLFATLMVAFAWPRLPHAFLLSWFACGLLVALARLTIARAFLREPEPVADPHRWAQRAAVAYGGTGFLWGILGAACIHYAPDAREYILVVVFLIMLFGVLNMQATAAHPLVFRAFLFSAFVPILAISVVEPAPNYVLRIILECLVLFVSLTVGRSGNRYVAESVKIRFENIELLQDLTRQKEDLDKAIAAKSHFLAAASHDLRQPMQAVVLLVESLQERVADPDTRRIVKSIRQSVASMATLLNGILDISKFDAGTVKPERGHFALNRVLERLRHTLADQAARGDLSFRVMRSSAIVETDPILLYRILANLAGNALRYTDRGRVVVGARRRRAGVEVQVWDTGPGIAQEDLGEIFREFHQLGNPQRDREQGLGLGLAIVERTATLLGHPLRVVSRVGHGSMFSITLPYGDAKSVRPPERAQADWASMEGCTVLVVDDDREIRAAMMMLLENWGCEVMCASSAAEALALLDNAPHPPDVVVADYRLPGEDNGIRVIRAVRARHPETSGVLISGDIAPTVLKEAEDSGYKLLHKPIRPARLRALLGNIWRERSAVREGVP
ncbi:MAG TPA: hybrid sensor histidine kinase/response regulator [Usitatibacter sp.]|nr:hybrid sensor histidine kinase/response regulator [Usitatibacter sp.]